MLRFVVQIGLGRRPHNVALSGSFLLLPALFTQEPYFDVRAPRSDVLLLAARWRGAVGLCRERDATV